jgi:hypothetical protein
MLTPAPSVRAKHLQLWLRLLDSGPAAIAQRFYATMRREHLDAVRDAMPLAWLPIALDVEMAEALLDSHGPRGAHEFYAAMFRAGREQSLLAPLARTAERLLGATPATFAKWLPMAWGALFRDAGAIRVESIERERAVLLYEGIPEECARSEAWVDSLASGLDPVFETTRTSGVVRTEKSALRDGRLVFTLAWTSPK